MKEIIRRAGETVMGVYDNPKVDYKEDQSPVTEADILSQKVIIEGLKSIGEDVILSEELPDDGFRAGKESIWIIDPLDGTSDFVAKTGEFSVMIGLVKKECPIFGMVYLPVSKKLYFAQKDKGAFVEQLGKIEQIKVSDVSSLREAKLVVSRHHLSEKDKKIADDLGVESYVQCGSNGVKICAIAEGMAEIFFNTWIGMGEWDCCGPEIILSEAGGMFTGINGQKIYYNKQIPRAQHGMVASNGILHEKIINKISS